MRDDLMSGFLDKLRLVGGAVDAGQSGCAFFVELLVAEISETGAAVADSTKAADAAMSKNFFMQLVFLWVIVYPVKDMVFKNQVRNYR